MNDYPGHGPDPGEDERIRRLLDDAVSDLEPREALGSIHARTKVTPMSSKRPWLLGAGGAVIATAATVAAVTVLSNEPPAPREPAAAGPSAEASATPSRSPSSAPSARPSATPSTPPPTATASQAPASAEATVPVYYVGDTSRGPRLYREFHRAEVTGGDQVSTGLAEAVAGDPRDPDYRSDWPEGTSARAVGGPTDVITVDVTGEASLRGRPGAMTKDQAAVAVEQLIYTAQAGAQSRDAVQFLLNGKRTDTLLGVPVSEPVSQGDPAEVLAQVWVIDPGEGATVRAPFKVSGVAAAFEATVQWELVQNGRTVREGFTTAEECCTMAPYSFTVKNVPAGDYTLVVHDSDPSGGEGFAPWQDTKSITVTD